MKTKSGTKNARRTTSKGELSTPLLTCMADVQAEAVPWLWTGRIPLGRLTALSGHPGEGKSFLTMDIAASVSTGRDFPDGTPCPLGSVIIVSAEDDQADTIRPRLDACEADVSRIHVLSGVQLSPAEGELSEHAFTLADVPALEAALKTHPDCRLVVIDPIGSYLGSGTDANRDNEVRGVLSPIALLAKRHGVAVVMVMHLRKSQGDRADDGVLGSRAFTGIARSVLHLRLDPDDKERRLLVSGKNNVAKIPCGWAFRIQGEPCRVVWEVEPVEMDADDALFAEARSAAERRKPGPVAAKANSAAEWLEGYLKNGSKLVSEVKAEAEKNGSSWRTVQRVKRSLCKVFNIKEGFGGEARWAWAADPGEWEPSFMEGLQTGRETWHTADDIENLLEAKFGKPVPRPDILARLSKLLDSDELEQLGEGSRKDPHRYRLRPVAQPCHDTIEDPRQVPDTEPNLAVAHMGNAGENASPAHARQDAEHIDCDMDDGGYGDGDASEEATNSKSQELPMGQLFPDPDDIN